MSIALMTQAFKTSLPPTHRFVFVALCDSANDQGMCYPSVSTLAEKTGYTERSVINSIKFLEENGYLKRELRSGRSSNYFITDPCTWFTPEPHSPLNDVHPTPERGSPITIIEPSIEPSGNRHKEKSPPKFSARRFLISLGVDEQVADDWLLHRKTKKGSVSKTVIEQHAKAASQAGVSLCEGLSIACARGWTGLKAEWITNHLSQNARASPYGKPSIAETNARIAEEIFGERESEPYTIDMETA